MKKTQKNLLYENVILARSLGLEVILNNDKFLVQTPPLTLKGIGGISGVRLRFPPQLLLSSTELLEVNGIVNKFGPKKVEALFKEWKSWMDLGKHTKESVLKELSWVIKPKSISAPLYRGLELPPDSAIREFEIGDFFVLTPRQGRLKFSSWTDSRKTAIKFSRWDGKTGFYNVVLKLRHDLRKEEVILAPINYLKSWAPKLLYWIAGSASYKDLLGEREFVLDLPKAKVEVIHNILFSKKKQQRSPLLLFDVHQKIL